MYPRLPRSQAARDRADWAAEIRQRLEFLRQVYERLPPGFTAGHATLTPGPDGSDHLRGPKGQNWAQFFDHTLARFTIDAVKNLTELSQYIEATEQDNFEARQQRRQDRTRLARVRDELLGADQLGISTKDGQRRIRAAIAALHDRDSDESQRFYPSRGA